MIKYKLLLLVVFCFLACNSRQVDEPKEFTEQLAQIINVECVGQPNNYTLNVTIASPDTGCDQYANWWEVITPEGQLIYRRILGHSHVDEQPFTRSGGPVRIEPKDTVIVRAHMNNRGYGNQIFRGVVLNDGLIMDSLDVNFATELENVPPQPGDCPF